jgi:hypothetical protein
MATSVIEDPPTIEQRKQLDEEVTFIEERLHGIIAWMREWYGTDSRAAIRAEETSGALQRLKWELERVQQAAHAAAV